MRAINGKRLTYIVGGLTLLTFFLYISQQSANNYVKGKSAQNYVKGKVRFFDTDSQETVTSGVIASNA